jgi:hypothetical protein
MYFFVFVYVYIISQCNLSHGTFFLAFEYVYVHLHNIIAAKPRTPTQFFFVFCLNQKLGYRGIRFKSTAGHKRLVNFPKVCLFVVYSRFSELLASGPHDSPSANVEGRYSFYLLY